MGVSLFLSWWLFWCYRFYHVGVEIFLDYEELHKVILEAFFHQFSNIYFLILYYAWVILSSTRFLSSFSSFWHCNMFLSMFLKIKALFSSFLPVAVFKTDILINLNCRWKGKGDSRALQCSCNLIWASLSISISLNFQLLMCLNFFVTFDFHGNLREHLQTDQEEQSALMKAEERAERSYLFGYSFWRSNES